MEDHDVVGTHLIAVWYRALDWAVDELMELGAKQLASLKVRSGEHLAAIVLTAFIRHPPVALDQHGEVDLLFDMLAQEPRALATEPLGDVAAFEVKSLPGDYRKREAELRQPGGPSFHQTVVQSTADVVAGAAGIITQAAATLQRKAAPGWSRNVLLVVHPFDHFAVETLSSGPVAHTLPPLNGVQESELATVWILWTPDHLTMWSTRHRRWTEMCFRACRPDGLAPIEPGELGVLQLAEQRFLAATGNTTDSPYIYGLRTASEPPDNLVYRGP